MKSKLPLILILGGILIGAITWFGYQGVNKKSSEQILYEGIMEQRQAERDRLDEARRLASRPLTTPASCGGGVTTGFIFEICEGEPDPGADWPEWTEIATAEEQRCILDAFHQTNQLAFLIQDKEYSVETPSTNRVSNFISDLCTAALFTDGVDYGDSDAYAYYLVEGYYKDRSESAVAPGHEY